MLVGGGSVECTSNRPLGRETAAAVAVAGWDAQRTQRFDEEATFNAPHLAWMLLKCS